MKAVVIDLFSRRVIGWSLQSRMQTDLALSALLMAVWRRKPKSKVVIHSDQGTQFRMAGFPSEKQSPFSQIFVIVLLHIYRHS